jgi:hypothetical protein
MQTIKIDIGKDLSIDDKLSIMKRRHRSPVTGHRTQQRRCHRGRLAEPHFLREKTQYTEINAVHMKRTL